MARARISRSAVSRNRRRPYAKRSTGMVSYRKRKSPVTSARSNIYNYKQTYYKTSAFQASPSGDLLLGFSFGLSNLGSNLTAFQQIYDQYSIRKIVMKFIPKFSAVESNVNNLVPIMTALDFDDADPPTSVQAVQEYQSCRITRGDRVHTRVFKPCANALMNAGAIAFAPKPSPWLDLGNPNVPHNGIKLAIPALPSGANDLDYDIEIITYVSFRGVR